MLNPSGLHGVEGTRANLGRSLRPQIPPSPSEPALGLFLPRAKGVLTDGPEAGPLPGERTNREASSQSKKDLHAGSRTAYALAHAQPRTWVGPRSQVPPNSRAFPLPTKGGTAAPARTLGQRSSAKFRCGNGKLEELGPAALDSRAGPGVREALKSTGGAAASGEPPSSLMSRRPRWGPRTVGLTSFTVVRCCRRPRPQAGPAPQARLMSGPRCLCPMGPTVSAAW